MIWFVWFFCRCTSQLHGCVKRAYDEKTKYIMSSAMKFLGRSFDSDSKYHEKHRSTGVELPDIQSCALGAMCLRRHAPEKIKKKHDFINFIQLLKKDTMIQPIVVLLPIVYIVDIIVCITNSLLITSSTNSFFYYPPPILG